MSEVHMTNRISRRQALRLALMGGVGGLLAACASTTQPAAQAPAPQPAATAALATRRAPTTIPTAAPTARATEPAQAVAGPAATAAPAAPAPTTATAPSALLAAEIGQAATQFLASLDDATRPKATYAFDDAERQRWHWTTPAGFPRNGLPLSEMNPDQRGVALDLLRASVSPTGYQKALDIMALQNELGNNPDLYYVTLFGAPGGSAPWGWRFEGHHLSRHFTLVGEQVSMTPFFLGAWPTATNAGLRAMDREEQAARELVLSLEGTNRETAIFQPRTLTRHVTQNQPFVSPLDPVGLAVGELSDDRKALVLEIIQTYLGALSPAIATPLFERLSAAGIENVRFGWAGSMEPRRPHYYRLQGPTFLLEFDNSRNSGTHIHSVWRDFAEDFGQQLVG
jgi:Protein of unknown function (DUF3500)